MRILVSGKDNFPSIQIASIPVSRVKGFPDEQVLILIRNKSMDQKAIVKPYFFSFYFSPFNSLFYPFLALCLHVAEKVLQITEVVIVNLIFAVGIDVGNKHSPGVLLMTTVNPRNDL